MLKNFSEVTKNVSKAGVAKTVAVAAANDEHSLEAVFKAESEGLIKSVLVGNKAEILSILEKHHVAKCEEDIIDAPDNVAAAGLAVACIREGKADFLMKGGLQTADLLRAVVNKETGLNSGRLMTHVVLNEVPNYHKLLLTTDGGMVQYPTLEQKVEILKNAVETLHALGYECPKVGVLAAVETVNPKMPETVEADQIKQMNLNGEITGCIVEGPISYDLAVSREVAEIKGFKSEVAGDVDILVSPNITTGNILGKSLICSAGAKIAGFIIGAGVPIILTSRGSSAEEKYLSLVLAAAVSQKAVKA